MSKPIINKDTGAITFVPSQEEKNTLDMRRDIKNIKADIENIKMLLQLLCTLLQTNKE